MQACAKPMVSVTGVAYVPKGCMLGGPCGFLCLCKVSTKGIWLDAPQAASAT